MLYNTFQLGAVIELGTVKPVPLPPHTEDVSFSPAICERLGRTTADEFWNILMSTAAPTLEEIFGTVLTPHRSTYYVSLHEGQCSLGEWKLHSSQIMLMIEPGQSGDKVRAVIDSEDRVLELPVTDVRFYRPPDWTVVQEAVYEMEGIIQSVCSDIILSVGLTREFAPQGFSHPVHWLQVNNIHVRSEPLWEGSMMQHHLTPIDLQ